MVSPMAPQHEVRASYDSTTIVVYQAYSPAIADAALRAGRFVPPFSFNRMTWIKPSFLWLMHRSKWAGVGAGWALGSAAHGTCLPAVA
jgi:hypothetical protein